jgi:hypothetical protein
MTRSLRRIDWAALGANLGSTLLFTLLLLSPFLWGAHYTRWLLGLAIGLLLGLYFSCAGTATASQAPTPTRPDLHADAPAPLAGCAR